MQKDEREAARLLGAAALAGNTDAEVEYGIALFNGTGVAKNEAAASNTCTRPRARAIPWRRTGSPTCMPSAAA